MIKQLNCYCTVLWLYRLGGLCRGMGKDQNRQNKTLPQQPEPFNQTASTASWIGAYSSFIFLSVMMHHCCTYGLRPMAQIASLPWQTAACILCLTQAREVALKWHRPDGREDFSMYCQNRKTECSRPGARQKQLTLWVGVINLFLPLC